MLKFVIRIIGIKLNFVNLQNRLALKMSSLSPEIRVCASLVPDKLLPSVFIEHYYPLVEVPESPYPLEYVDLVT